MAASARREVLSLYKRLLKLHEALPSDFATLGRRFVQEEFKRHKNSSPEQATMFTKEWTVSASAKLSFLYKGSLRERGIKWREEG